MSGSGNKLPLDRVFDPCYSTHIDSKEQAMNKVFDPFHIKEVENDMVEVWDGPPEDVESEFIYKIHKSLVAELIETLKMLT
jgi:hypothetical protein